MVTKRKQHSSPRPVKQGRGARASRPNKIGASTPYHFRGKNLTPYGGLLPVATLLEKLDFQALLEETITTKRITRAMSPYQFVLALVLGLYVGFARLNQLRFIARDPILTGILTRIFATDGRRHSKTLKPTIGFPDLRAVLTGFSKGVEAVIIGTSLG